MNEKVSTERIDFQAEFGKVTFKTQPKWDKDVLVTIEFIRAGTATEMKEWENALQPTIDNGIEGFVLTGEDKTRKKKNGDIEIYHDELIVPHRFTFEKCTSELGQAGAAGVKIAFCVGWPIEHLDDVPQELLKFRGQKCDVRLKYFVRQQELNFGGGETDTHVGKFVDGLQNMVNKDGGSVTLSTVDASGNEETILEVHPEKTGGEMPADEFIDRALALFVKKGVASVSMLQREFGIGYNRAFKIVSIVERLGFVGAQNGMNPRAVLDKALAYLEKGKPDGTGTSVTITAEDAEKIVAKGKKPKVAH